MVVHRVFIIICLKLVGKKMKTPGEIFLEEMKIKLANMSNEEFNKRVDALFDGDNEEDWEPKNLTLTEQIKDKAIKFAQSKTDFTDEDWAYQYSKFYEQAYTEMIIKACLDEVETYCVPVGNSPAGEIAFEWTVSALTDISDNIKEKFGLQT